MGGGRNITDHVHVDTTRKYSLSVDKAVHAMVTDPQLGTHTHIEMDTVAPSNTKACVISIKNWLGL